MKCFCLTSWRSFARGSCPDNFIPLPQRLDDLVLKNRITQRQREAVGL